MFFDVCILLVCVQHSAALLSKGTAEASDWLVPLSEWLLKATEREVSSENYRILPGYYLRSPGTAKESQAEWIKILTWNHVTTVRAVRCTVCARKSSLTQLQCINRCTLCFKSTLFILEPPNQCSNHLQLDELGGKTNRECLPFHSWFWGGWLVSSALYWNRQCYCDCYICQLQVKNIKAFTNKVACLANKHVNRPVFESYLQNL